MRIRFYNGILVEMDKLICETSRLILRKIDRDDFGAFLEILGDPEVMKFSVRGPANSDGVQKFLDATEKRYERDGVAQWAVVEKESGAVIGECGISVQHIDGLKEYEIGYRFSRQKWGKEYATEAAIACRDYGFKKLGLKRIISIIEAKNQRSIRVAEKVGKRIEKNSTFYDIPVCVYSIENKESES